MTIYVAVGGSTGGMPLEFLLEFREWKLKYPNSREQGFDFGIMDYKNADMVNPMLIDKYLGSDHWDKTPTIFALHNFGSGAMFEPIGKYNGTNFEEISEGLKQKIDKGEVKPVCRIGWNCILLNVCNIDYWTQNSRAIQVA